MRVNFNVYKNVSFARDYKKEDTITVLGSSSAKNSILNSMQLCSEVTKSLIEADKNILSGCGTNGIMGACYNAAKENSIKENGKPVQNLSIIKEPLWGDEDLENCVVIGKANTEGERVQKFAENSDTFIVFPGGPATIQEASTVIADNYYGKDEDKKKIIFVGSDYYKGLKDQYDKLYQDGLIKKPSDELFTIADTKEEILSAANN